MRWIVSATSMYLILSHYATLRAPVQLCNNVKAQARSPPADRAPRLLLVFFLSDPSAMEKRAAWSAEPVSFGLAVTVPYPPPVQRPCLSSSTAHYLSSRFTEERRVLCTGCQATREVLSAAGARWPLRRKEFSGSSEGFGNRWLSLSSLIQ